MYKWRANECDVTVANGRVTDIQLVGSQDPGGGNTDYRCSHIGRRGTITCVDNHQQRTAYLKSLPPRQKTH
jgi:hypothetical protein